MKKRNLENGIELNSQQNNSLLLSYEHLNNILATSTQNIPSKQIHSLQKLQPTRSTKENLFGTSK